MTTPPDDVEYDLARTRASIERTRRWGFVVLVVLLLGAVLLWFARDHGVFLAR